MLVLVGLLLLPLPSAAASCVEGSGPDGAPVVFVGTAEEERRGYTRFAVEEVWAGPDLAPQVWVLSGSDQAPWPVHLVVGASSSVDADFVRGRRYAVGASRAFATNACQVASGDAVASPTSARKAVATGSTGANPPLGPVGQALWAAGLIGIAVLAVGFVRRRRRSVT